MLLVILQIGFYVVFFKYLYEATEAVAAGCVIASRVISFVLIKQNFLMTSLLSRPVLLNLFLVAESFSKVQLFRGTPNFSFT